MAVTLITTVGAATANSYATKAGADAYFLNRLSGTAWASLASDIPAQSLLAAMAILEDQAWIGDRASTVQALQWPRLVPQTSEQNNAWPWRFPDRRNPRAPGWEDDGDVIEDSGLRDMRGRLWVATAIPTPIIEAQYELAFALGTSAYNLSAVAAAVVEYETDRLRVKLAEGSGLSNSLPDVVTRLLAPFLMLMA